MDYEKEYKKKLDAAKYWHDVSEGDIPAVLEEIFSELAESEDNRVRKELTEFLKRASGGFLDTTIQCKKFGKWLAWIEKQGEQKPEIKYIYPKFRVGDVIEPAKPNGSYIPVRVRYISDGSYSCESDDRKAFSSIPICNENEYVLTEQKPADKPELKFNEGDWVVNKLGVAWYIDGFDKKNYQVIGRKGNHNYFPIAKQDEIRHWSITDAKPGDVLIDHCDDYKNPLIFILKKFERVDFGLAQKSDYSSYCFLSMSDKPRFKEGDFHHMKDIKPATKEQRDLLFQKMKEAGYEWNPQKKELKKIEHKPMLSDFFNAEYERGKADALKCVGYSEEDEKIINKLIAVVELYYGIGDDSEKQICLSWLKSLKQRMGWKPSDEQIGVIEAVINNRSFQRRHLDSLYEQLKKLKGE